MNPFSYIKRLMRADRQATRLARARALFNAKHYDAAATILRKLLTENPAHFAALTLLAETANALNRPDEAMTCHRALFRLEQRRLARVFRAMASTYDARGMSDAYQAIEECVAQCGLGGTPAALHCAIQRHADNSDWERITNILLVVIEFAPLTITHPKTAALTKSAHQQTDQKEAVAASLHRAIAYAETNHATFKELARNVTSGTETDATDHYYDDVYRDSPIYKSGAEDSLYLPAWEHVMKQLATLNYRNVLDLGCGPGQFAEYLLHHRPDTIYTGADFSQVAIDSATHRCPNATFIRADIEANPQALIQQTKCDVVLLLEVLEHMHRDRELLQLLPARTPVIASVPNFLSFSHVRSFDDADTVRARYQSVLPDVTVTPIPLSGTSVLFLLYGNTI